MAKRTKKSAKRTAKSKEANKTLRVYNLPNLGVSVEAASAQEAAAKAVRAPRGGRKLDV